METAEQLIHDIRQAYTHYLCVDGPEPDLMALCPTEAVASLSEADRARVIDWINSFGEQQLACAQALDKHRNGRYTSLHLVM